MAAPSIPNFFIAGAPETGTTWLYHHLRQHPDVFMSPVAEPSYFSFEVRPENFGPELHDRIQHSIEILRAQLAVGNPVQGIAVCREDYLKLFDGACGQHAIGEASVCYLSSKTAAREIAAFNPSAKIILILRHPAERAFAQYLHYLSNGEEALSFSEYIAADLKNNSTLSRHHPFLDLGFYSQQLERFLDHIPGNQLRVWLYEDTLADSAKFFREVLTFLDVDPNFQPDVSHRNHEMKIPKTLALTAALRRGGMWRALRNATPASVRPLMKKLVYRQPGSLTMNTEDRRFLTQYYRDDVRRLERVIERDLSEWQR